MGSKIRMRRLTWSARLEKVGIFRTQSPIIRDRKSVAIPMVDMRTNAHVIHSAMIVPR
jgi:hypothetical protein